MPADLYYLPAEGTALVTPDALRVMLNQSGLACDQKDDEHGPVLVVRSDETALLLDVEGGFVSGVAVGVTFVDGRAKFPRVCELLESLGWEQAEE